ncbi:DUF4388 domain-containing protein [Sulfidibacter corallicola]|uniref:DUF4388 domain-containing protein n=1 Tax=Sulfidibacter corallicola TaxID=2818388 RepID=A0A8A4TR38_SULCO|nr:DUF4388 domain-containing protein [Sulfidibacter corallicola]QTD52010.1 DUF4388 domain-containing protein [Sulfidibacter corallicola]
MSTQALRGKIEPLALIDVFAYLGRHSETGILNVIRDDVKKTIVIHQGKIIFARSNQVQDRLGDCLLAKGLITQEQYDRATELIFEKRYRHGRALVEIGAISPKLLWDAIQDQIKTIAVSVIPYDSGSFEFIRQEIKHKESITLQYPILELVIDAIRHLEDRSLFETHFLDGSVIYARVEDKVPEEHVQLEPYERYVYDFFDGKTSLNHVCENSDIGREESLRVVYLLRSLDLIEPRGVSEEEEDAQSVHPLIVQYNEMFRFITDYLSQRVGSMGTSLLKKYFEDARNGHPQIFAGVTLQGNGAPSKFMVQENLDAMEMDENGKTLALEEAMDEYLFACILAVKKMLGTEHEAEVLRHIQSQG